MAKKQAKAPAKKLAKKLSPGKSSSNHIHTLEIKNFKSIKNMKLEPKKINIFIGKPNVGKSNMLEAISLLGSSATTWQKPFLGDQIRYETFDNLFYDRDTEQPIQIISNIGFCLANRYERGSSYNFIVSGQIEHLSSLKKSRDENQFRNFVEKRDELNSIKDDLIPSYYVNVSNTGDTSNIHHYTRTNNSIVKKYEFLRSYKFDNLFNNYLIPPHGNNQYAVIRKHKNLHKEIGQLFSPQKLKFVIKSESNIIELQKQSRGISVSFPYSGVADTLQRYIFYSLAIKTNKESVLLFEEPEVHSHPAYIRQIAEMVIGDEKNNQFFITTHSPFILNIILENAKKEDVAVFKLDYKNYQTVAEPLSEKEIDNYLNYGTDIFFQLLK